MNYADAIMEFVESWEWYAQSSCYDDEPISKRDYVVDRLITMTGKSKQYCEEQYSDYCQNISKAILQSYERAEEAANNLDW